MPSGVIIAEAPSGRIVLGNVQVERIFRRRLLPLGSAEEYGQWPGFHRDGRHYQSEEWPLARAVRAGEEVLEELIDIVRGDDTCGTISVSAAPICDEAGRLVAGVAVLTDVTERQQAEAERERLLAEVQKNASALDATINSMPHGVMIYTTHGEGAIVRWNPAAAEMTGFTEEECCLPVAERWRRLGVTTPDGQPFPPEEIPAQRALNGEEVPGVVAAFPPRRRGSPLRRRGGADPRRPGGGAGRREHRHRHQRTGEPAGKPAAV